MKTTLCTVLAAISLLSSPCVLAYPNDDAGSANGVIRGGGTMDNGDSNGIVQGSGAIEGQDASNNPPLDDNTTNSALGAGVSRDGETMGEED
jgi:hypothetical protein